MTGFTISNIEESEYGRTLYVNPLPQKICTFDCVFCPLGERTALKTDRSTSFTDTNAFLIQLKEAIAHEGAEAVFISADGEPLANERLIDIINLIKAANCKVIIISNGYVFGYEEYMAALNLCDVVIGELMAATERDFQKLLRPIDGYTLQQHIANLEGFNKQYSGNFILSVTVLRGYSDSEEALSFYKNAVRRIKPDSVEVETPYKDKLKTAFGAAEDTIRYFQEELNSIIS